MILSVKNKIWLGTLFLFLLLILTGGAGIYYTVQLKDQVRAVLQDNYETLAYAHIMQQQLDSLPVKQQAAINTFDSVLKLQERNVTEAGELQATQGLRSNLIKLEGSDTSKYVMQQMQSNIQQILRLNMNAIHKKSQLADAAANDAFSFILTLAGIVFLIAFTFIFNFPSIITTPINKLAEAIQEIANKNYRYRIHIDNKDEFGKLADAFNEMAARLEYFENSNLNKLLFEKSRAEAVINSLKDASIGIDKNNKVLFANAQALLLLGLKSTEIVGRTGNEISTRNDLFRFLTDSDNKAPFKIVVDDRENYFIKEIVEVEQGDTRSKVIVIKNVTSFKELDVAKTNFIATITHELKTPLASSDFSLKLLDDERVSTLTPDQKELVQNIKGDNQRMLKILSELLNMSQVETGRIQLNKQRVHPAIIISSAVETVASAAKEKGIKLEEHIENNLPEIEADAEKTTWVINNFLTNAIKNSPADNSIGIHVEHRNGSILVSVTDHGPGIAREYQSRLFERYFQVPGSKSKGNGLGLAISKDFIEAQGGSIGVESEIGQGAKFYFELPV